MRGVQWTQGPGEAVPLPLPYASAMNAATGGLQTTGQLYRRNRHYEPLSGQFTQMDPIGLAGGSSLFGFAAGDPANFGDPFGLCAAGPDSVQLTVTVICSGSGEEGRDQVWAYRVTDAEALTTLDQQTTRLTEGNAAFTPQAVAEGYAPVIAAGDVYVFGFKSVGGHTVAAGGVYDPYPIFAFRADYWGGIQAGALGVVPPGAGSQFSVANVIGHEGVHRLQDLRGQPRTERVALRVPWGWR